MPQGLMGGVPGDAGGDARADARMRAGSPRTRGGVPPAEARVLDLDPLEGYFERLSAPRPALATSKAAWIARRAQVRARLLASLGLDPMPERLPLDVRYGGSLELASHSVRRLYWQTWPRVWASGWLYLPAGGEPGTTSPFIGVLAPHGHWEGGNEHEVTRAFLTGLTQQGYAVLAPDSVHIEDPAVGLTPMSAMTFTNLRALDVLQQLPGVDRDRIGIAGASGGAAQAMYALALDEKNRLRAASLSVSISYFRRILAPNAERCHCNYVPGLLRFTDQPELCALAAPRALQFLTRSEDWTASFPDAELGELRSLYRLWGQEDRLEHRQFAGAHAFDRAMRQSVYDWFARELRGGGGVEPAPEAEITLPTVESLRALNAAPAEDRGPEGIIDWFRRRRVAQPPAVESRDGRRAHQERLRADLRDLLGSGLDAVPAEVRAAGPGGLLTLATEGDVRIRARWSPAGPADAPTVLVAHPDGVDAVGSSDRVSGLAALGWNVLAPEVRLTGALRREWRLQSRLWGRPESGMAETDLRACFQWLHGHPEIEPRRLLLLGVGELGVAALLAAGLDERIPAVMADCGDTTYRDGGAGLPEIADILRLGDIPQIAGLVAPRSLWLYNVPGDRVGFASRRYFDWTRRMYQGLGADEALKMSTGPGPDPAALDEWLRRRFRRGK